MLESVQNHCQEGMFRRLTAQCRLVFVKSTFCIDRGADPRSAADTPVGLPTPGNGWFHWAKGGSKGTRAD